MTRVKTDKRTPSLRPKALAGALILTWERLLPVIAAPIIAVCVWLGAAFAGAPAFLGQIWTGLSIVLALGCLTWLAVRLWRFRLPDLRDGLRRIEQDEGLSHRPLSDYGDRVAGRSDSAAQLLWEAQKRRDHAASAAARPRKPRAVLAGLDPVGLRFAALLVLGVGIVIGWGEWDDRLDRAVSFQDLPLTPASPPAHVEAWVDPPAYTGRAPISLARDGEALDFPEVLQVPQGSRLAVRVTSGRASLRAVSGDTDGFALERAGTGFVLDTTLEESVRLALLTGGQRALWPLEVSPDASPQVSFKGSPERADQGQLSFDLSASDDFGIERLELVLERVQCGDGSTGNASAPNQSDARGCDEDPFSVSLNRFTGQARIDTTASVDLVSHPWAGLQVDMHLRATDAAGQVGRSETRTITLPERVFSDPLALAAIEQRKHLASGGSVDRAAKVLDAVAIMPSEHFDYGAEAYQGLRAARYALSDIRPKRSMDLLWSLAVALEGTDLEAAKRALEAAKRDLMEALASGASDEEIQRLMSRLQEAMDTYLQALTEQALRDFAEGDLGSEMMSGGGVSQLDRNRLNAMLEALRELSEAGDAEAARDLLAELSSILENLQIQIAAGQGQNGQSSPFDQALDGLSEMIGRQRQLLDENYRAEPGDRQTQQDLEERQSRLGEELEGLREEAPPIPGQPQAGTQNGQGQDQGQGQGQAPAPGSEGQSGTGPGEGQEAQGGNGQGANNQGSAGGGLSADEALSGAQRDMERSRQALGRGDREAAGRAMSDAIENLREGAEALAQEAQRRREAQNGQSGGGQAATDPLGRPLGQGSGTVGDGSGVRVPDDMERLRAREILELLRERANDPNLSEEERAYIKRLLDLF